MSKKQIIIASISVIAIIILFAFGKDILAWMKSLGGDRNTSRDANEVGQPVVQQVLIPVVPVTPKPVTPTCDTLKNQISHFTNLLAQYPNSVQIKNALDQFKKQYVDKNCGGGLKPNPESAI